MGEKAKDRILVNHTPWWTRIAVEEEGVLSHFEIEKYREGPRYGDIFKGGVVNVVQGLQAAFVNLGTGKPGYLYIDDVLRTAGEGKKIKNLLKPQKLQQQQNKENIKWLNNVPKVAIHAGLFSDAAKAVLSLVPMPRRSTIKTCVS